MYCVRRMDSKHVAQVLKYRGTIGGSINLLRNCYTTRNPIRIPLKEIPIELKTILDDPPPEILTNPQERQLLSVSVRQNDPKIAELEKHVASIKSHKNISGLENCLQNPVRHIPTNSLLFIYGSNHICKQCPKDIEEFFDTEEVDHVCVESSAKELEYHRKRIKYLGYDNIDLSLLNSDDNFFAGELGADFSYLPSSLAQDVPVNLKKMAVKWRIFSGMELTTAIAKADEKGLSLSRIDVKRGSSGSLRDTSNFKKEFGVSRDPIKVQWRDANPLLGLFALNKIVYGIRNLSVNPLYVHSLAGWFDAPCPMTETISDIVLCGQKEIIYYHIGFPRDLFMAGYLQRLCFMSPERRILVVVGAAHAKGIRYFLRRHVPQEIFRFVSKMREDDEEKWYASWKKHYLGKLLKLTDPEIDENKNEMTKMKKDPQRYFQPTFY